MTNVASSEIESVAILNDAMGDGLTRVVVSAEATYLMSFDPEESSILWKTGYTGLTENITSGSVSSHKDVYEDLVIFTNESIYCYSFVNDTEDPSLSILSVSFRGSKFINFIERLRAIICCQEEAFHGRIDFADHFEMSLRRIKNGIGMAYN